MDSTTEREVVPSADACFPGVFQREWCPRFSSKCYAVSNLKIWFLAGGGHQDYIFSQRKRENMCCWLPVCFPYAWMFFFVYGFGGKSISFSPLLTSFSYLIFVCLSVCLYLFPALSWWCSSRMTPIRTQGKRLIAGSTPSSFCLSPTGPSEFYLSLVKCLEKFLIVRPRGVLMILHRKHGEHVRCGTCTILGSVGCLKWVYRTPIVGVIFQICHRSASTCHVMFGQQSSLSSKWFITLQQREIVGSRNCMSWY